MISVFLFEQVAAELLNDILPIDEVGDGQHAQRTEAKEKRSRSVPRGARVTAKHGGVHQQGQTQSQDNNYPQRKHGQLPVAAVRLRGSTLSNKSIRDLLKTAPPCITPVPRSVNAVFLNAVLFETLSL